MLMKQVLMIPLSMMTHLRKHFGTPDMYRPDTSRRYTDKELDSMTLNERLKERLRCSKEKNVLGQRDIFTYEFKKYGVSASDTILPTISFLYAKNQNALSMT